MNGWAGSASADPANLRVVFMIQVGHEDLARVIGQGTTPAHSMAHGEWERSALDRSA